MTENDAFFSEFLATKTSNTRSQSSYKSQLKNLERAAKARGIDYLPLLLEDEALFLEVVEDLNEASKSRAINFRSWYLEKDKKFKFEPQKSDNINILALLENLYIGNPTLYEAGKLKLNTLSSKPATEGEKFWFLLGWFVGNW